MSTRALIVIDIQNDYFPGGKWTLHNVDDAADNAARVIASARSSGDVIVHIRHEFPSADAPFFVPNSEGSEIHSKVLPQQGEPVIVKNQINSFRDTNLKSLLDSKGITDVTIIGAMTHMCIDSATRAAADFGYRVVLVHDACASRDLEFDGVMVPAPQVHAAYMSVLGGAFAKVTSTDEYLSATALAA